MSRLIMILFFGVSAFFAYKHFQKPKFKSVQLSMLNGPYADYNQDQTAKMQACSTKPHCLLVYVAPWCPACHQWIDTFPRFKTMLDGKGVETLVVVGADDNRQNEINFLKNVSMFNSVLDTPTNDFRKRYKINSFPFFMVINSKSQVLHYGKSSVDFVNKKLNEK